MKKKKSFFLVKNSIDEDFFKQYPKYYLGYFCLNHNSNLKNFNSKNVLENHWQSKKEIKKKYNYIRKVSNILQLLLKKNLNWIHKRNENLNYWRIIIFPWVCSYVVTLYDRWQIISKLQKKKNYSFFTHEYTNEKKISEIYDMEDWINKTQSELFNNYLFNKIIREKKIKNIKIKKKKSKKIYFNFEKLILNKYSFFNKILSTISIYFNRILFDNINYNKFLFFKLSLQTFNIPSRSLSFFTSKIFKNFYNFHLRKKIEINLKASSKFEQFLFKELVYLFPKSYLENYQSCINYFKNFLKEKRLIVGSNMIQFNDCFKIFLAESKLKKSRYIYLEHGAGIYSSKDVLFNHFYKVSDKFISGIAQIKKYKKIANLGLDIFFKEKKFIKKKEKILINFHEFRKYIFRIPFTNPPFSEEVKEFRKILLGFEKLENKVKKQLKFRVKETAGLGSKKRFSKIFGANSIENTHSIKYSDSILESKLVICFIPQTSYFECIYRNIPTILIGNRDSFFDTNERKNLLRKLKLNNMYFENISEAIKFLNNNSNNYLLWWQSKKTQIVKNYLLKKYYPVSKGFSYKFKEFLKEEIKSLN